MSNMLKRCASCGTALQFLKRENIQLGKTGWILGDWPNLWAGAQDLEFWVCPNCRKLEFYVPDAEELIEEGNMAQTTCPTCGTQHDLDDPKCPRCGAKNPKW